MADDAEAQEPVFDKGAVQREAMDAAAFIIDEVKMMTQP